MLGIDIDNLLEFLYRLVMQISILVMFAQLIIGFRVAAARTDIGEETPSNRHPSTFGFPSRCENSRPKNPPRVLQLARKPKEKITTKIRIPDFVLFLFLFMEPPIIIL